MPDWIIYLIIFVMVGSLTLLEEAAKNYDSIFNRKVLKFLPVKHIFTAVAVAVCLVSLVLYCVDGANRTASLILCLIGIFFLAIVVAIDIFIVFKHAKNIDKISILEYGMV